MSHAAPELPNIPPLSMCLAVLAGELPAPTAAGTPPEWIKVTPRGTADTRDGRRYTFDPEALVSRFKADGVDVPVDLDHGLALRATKGERVDAVGYAAALEARQDGTYARITWLDGGKAALSARTHRYVSPSFPHDSNGQAKWLHSISLVAAPALSGMPALAAAHAGDTSPGTVAEALGLDPAADEAACLARLSAIRSEFVPLSLFNDTVATLNVANGTIAELRTAERRTRVETLIEGALKARKIVPAQRAQYEALCSTDAGLAHVASLFAATVPHLQPSGLDGRHPEAGGDESPITLAARATRYRDQQRQSGSTLSQADAIAFCVANPGAGK
ncbi:phage protease [Methylobacterium brachiatum]|uniref:phage protease n=1 Tax=Methylobacterium brachiatum TaxID=269660 RepID=UPI0008F23B59|nr:phage protease [Methylobacterium brachiatum]SFI18154.1 Mu-like prophage I protein [Methylobacterium brachiatum]